MNIEYYPDHAAIGSRGASVLIEALSAKSDLLLCAATGNSPLSLYKKFVRHREVNEKMPQKLRIVTLDEWIGPGANSVSSCNYYLRSHLIEPLSIDENRFLAFNAEAPDPAAECARMQSQLRKIGPVDLCILGLGKNGHIGLNEPGPFLQPHCHVATLSPSSKQHGMLTGSEHKPQFGMTLGMADILSSRKILLIVSGAEKERALQNLLSGKITTECPASFLWLHRNVDCLIEKRTDR